MSFLIVRLKFIRRILLVLVPIQFKFFLHYGKAKLPHTHPIEHVRLIILRVLIWRLMVKRRGNKLFCTQRQKIEFPNIWVLKFIQMTNYLFCTMILPCALVKRSEHIRNIELCIRSLLKLRLRFICVFAHNVIMSISMEPALYTQHKYLLTKQTTAGTASRRIEKKKERKKERKRPILTIPLSCHTILQLLMSFLCPFHRWIWDQGIVRQVHDRCCI